MKKTLGIVNLHHNISLGDLTKKRSIASVNLLGRYSFVDFVISNYTNSGINDIIILVKEQMRSLLHHLGFGQLNYTINLKTGGLSILINEQFISNPIYNTDVNNMLENIRYLENSDADYVIISPAHMLNAVDYAPYIKEHESSGREISILYKNVDNAKTEFLNSFFIDLNGHRVTNIEINKGLKKHQAIFLETTIINRLKLLDLIKKGPSVSKLYCFRDILIHHLKEELVGAMEYKGYLKCFDCLDHYAEFSLQLLEEDVRSTLFAKPIYTRSYDTPPARYGPHSQVCNSFIANGAVINGSVTHSIIGREVVIEEGAVVTNSIILAHTKVAKGSIIDRVVIDKNVTVSATKEIKGGLHYNVVREGEKV